jgi:hypothetical protein
MKGFLAAVAIAAAIGFAGGADLEEEQRHVSQYCEFVADGTWPAYDPSIHCSEEK